MQPLSPSLAHERQRFVEDLLAIMTIEEKIGQLVMLNSPPDPTRPGAFRQDADFFDHLRHGYVGAVRSVGGTAHAQALQRIAVEESRLGIPLLIATPPNAPGDIVLPPPIALAASFSPRSWSEAGRLAAEEALDAGANWLFGDPLALAQYLSEFGYLESTGESAWLAAQVAIARLRAIEGATPGRAPQVLGCLAIAQGEAQTRRGRSAEAVADELQTILTVIDSATPASFAIDTGRADLAGAGMSRGAEQPVRPRGYDGILLGDWLDFAVRAGQHEGPAPYCELSVQRVAAAVAAGTIAPEALDDAVRRVLGAKFALGLFREALAPPVPQRTRARAPQERRDATLSLARRGIVLLRNTGGLLPLDSDSGELLVVGSAASDAQLPLGSAPGHAVTLVEGLEAAGLRFRTVPGLALRHDAGRPDRMIDADRMAIGMAAEAARRARTVLVVLGRTAGPGEMTEAQAQLLAAVQGANPRTALVTLGDRPLDPDVAGEPLACVLHAGPLGTLSGHALADVLTGACQPGGRLPVTLRTRAGQLRLPYGHGLSYTEFTLADFSAELGPEGLAVSALLRNAGEREGETIAQLYIQRIDGTLPMAAPSMRGLRRQILRPGESERIGFLLGAGDLGHYRPDGLFALEAATYVVRIGLNAERALGAEIALPASFAQMLSAAPIGGSYVALPGRR